MFQSCVTGSPKMAVTLHMLKLLCHRAFDAQFSSELKAEEPCRNLVGVTVTLAARS